MSPQNRESDKRSARVYRFLLNPLNLRLELFRGSIEIALIVVIRHLFKGFERTSRGTFFL